MPARDDGRKISCGACGHKFYPPDDEEDGDDDRPRSRARRRDDDDDEPRPRKARVRDDDDRRRQEKQPSIPLVAWISGGVIAAAILGVGLYLIFKPSKRNEREPEVVQANPVQPNPANPFVPPPVNNGPAPGPIAQPKPPANPEEAQALAAWTAAPDPSDPKLHLPANGAKVKVPLDFGTPFFLPTSPSPFVAVGQAILGNNPVTLWDLRTGQQAGQIKSKNGLHPPTVLSPDGKYMAAKAALNWDFDVYEFASGKVAHTIKIDTILHHWADFGATSDELQVISTTSNLQDLVFRRWNVSSGALINSIMLPRNINQQSIALSPGRRQLAVAAGKYLWLYRIADGKLLGTRPLPDFNGAANATLGPICQGLAFSSDGAEVAGMFKAGNQEVIAAWNVATGKLEAEHDVTDIIANQQTPLYAPNLEYLPDGQAWLVRNNFVIDRQTGSSLLKLHPERVVGFRSRLRVLSNDSMLVVSDEKAGKKVLATAPFDRAAYDAAAKAVRGASSIAATPADRSAVKSVAIDAKPAWAVAPDPVKAGKKEISSTITLSGPAQSVYALMSSSPEVAKLATLSIVEVKNPYLHSELVWDRYNQVSGEKLDSAALGPTKKPSLGSSVVAALSPNAERIAVRNIGDRKRVDLWGADGKHLGAFVPSKTGGDVEWFAYLAEDQLLTLAGGQLTLWNVPGFKAVYETGPGLHGMPALSPNRRWIAAPGPTGIYVMEAVTGVCRGHVASEADARPNAVATPTAAFSVDGTRLAGALETTAGGSIVVCDVATGKKTQSISTLSPRGQLQWCGGFLLNDFNLLDIDSKIVAWRYAQTGSTARGAYLRNTPDGRFWHIQDTSGRIAAATLPDAKTKKVMEQVKQPGTKTLIGPGATVSLQVTAAGADANVITDVKAELTRSLSKVGLNVGDAGAVILTVNATLDATKELYQVQTIGGGGNNSSRTFPLKQLNASISLTDKSGRVIWKDTHSIKQSGSSRIFRNNEDPEQVMTAESWKTLKIWSGAARLPERVYLEPSGDLVVLPGNSPMTPDQ